MRLFDFFRRSPRIDYFHVSDGKGNELVLHNYTADEIMYILVTWYAVINNKSSDEVD